MSDEETRFPILTVDGVIFQLIHAKLHVLLIQRAYEPFLGKWALPGGYNPAGQTTLQALDRMLLSKTGMHVSQLSHLEQLCTIDTVARDPRGHAVSVVYLGLSRDVTTGGKDTQNPQFYPVNQLPPLAYDHDKLISRALYRLKERLTYTNVAAALLPPSFTLSELQTAYETILGRQLDKRNFRKKIAALHLVTRVDGHQQKAAHRPAQLYRFAHEGPTVSTMTF